MKTYSVQKQFTSWEEVFVEADNEQEALDTATTNWFDLEPEGIGEYYETDTFIISELKPLSPAFPRGY